MTNRNQEIIDSAVARMRAHQAVAFSGEDYGSRFTAEFNRFGERMATVIALQIHATLAAHLSGDADDQILGNHLKPDTRTIRGVKGTDVIDVMTALDPDSHPRFTMTARIAKGGGSEKDLEQSFELTVLESYGRSAGMGGNYQVILTSYLDFYDGSVIDMSDVHMTDFRAILEFSKALMQALPSPPEPISSYPVPRISVHQTYKALVDADGGLPGVHVEAAVNLYSGNTAGLVCDWAASVIPSVVASQMSRGFVWGSKYLNYNDLDDSCCAIQTDFEGRSALFHENTSLINPYQGYIAWVDRNADNEPLRLCVHMIHNENPLGHAVDLLKSDELVPTLAIEFATREISIADNYLDTDLLRTLSFYLRTDEKMYVEGAIDRYRGKNSHTDFSVFFPDEHESVRSAAPN